MNDKYFYGHKVSNYGASNGLVDYSTFAKALGGYVLCNDIFELLNMNECEYYNLSDDENTEYFQYYLIANSDFNKYLLDLAHEAYVVCEEHDILVWCIDHFGTAWDMVCTRISLEDE